MAALCNRAGHIYFHAVVSSSSFLFPRLMPYFHTWCGLSVNLECRSEACCARLAENTARKKSPKSRHLVSSWCDHSMLASSLWQCLRVPSLLQLCWEPTHLFSLLSTKHAESFSVLSSQRSQDVCLYSSWLQVTLAFSLVLSSLKSVFCDFSIFSAVMPRLPALYLTWYGILSYTHHLP